MLKTIVVSDIFFKFEITLKYYLINLENGLEHQQLVRTC